MTSQHLKNVLKSFPEVPVKTPVACKNKPQSCPSEALDHAQVENLLSESFAHLALDMDESERECFAKEFAQTAWDSKQTKREEHSKQAYRLDVAKKRKAQRKRSMRGRKIVNHASEDPPSYNTPLKVSSDDPPASHPPLTHLERFEECKRSWAEKALIIEGKLRLALERATARKEFFTREVGKLHDLVDTPEMKQSEIITVGMQLTSFVFALATCENWVQVSAASFQMITACLGTFQLTQTMTDLIRKATTMNHVEDQASFADFSNAIRSIHASKMNLDSIPVYNQLGRLCVLGSLLGLLPKTIHTEGVIQNAYAIWLEGIENRATHESWIDLIFETMAFASEFIAMAYTGEVGKLFKPYGATERALQLSALAVHFSNGVLEDFDMTESAYAEEIGACIDALRIERSGKSFALRNMYDKQISDMLKLKNLVHATLSVSKKRVPPPIFIFYGESQIGKSAVTYRVMSYLGRQFKFPHEDRNIWYPAKDDDYDSGYTGNVTVIIEDDIACEKPDKTTVKQCYNFLRYNNIIPYTTVQAEIEKKGVISFTHKIVLGSTNVRNLNLHHHMATPSAGYNRAHFYETVLLPKYADEVGKIDPERVEEDIKLGNIRIKEDAYRFHRYVLLEKTKGVDWHYVKQNMTYAEFLLDVREVYRKHNDKGKHYLSMIEDFCKEIDCEKCHLPTALCTCPTIEDQAFGNVFMDVTGATALALSSLTAYLPNPQVWVLTRVLPPIYGVLINQTMQFIIDVIGISLVHAFHSLSYFLRRNAVVGLWLASGLLPCCWWLVTGSNPVTTYIRYWFWVWLVLTWCFALRLKYHLAKAMGRTLLDNSMASRLMLNLGASGVAIASAYTAIIAIKTAARVMNQGALVPKNMAEVEQRNAEENKWLAVKCMPLVTEDTPIAGMTPAQAHAKVAANVVFVHVTTREGMRMGSNALMIKANVIMLPNHVAERVDTQRPITVIRSSKSVGFTIEDVYLSNYTRLVDNVSQKQSFHDAAMFTMSKCVTFADITDFFTPSIEMASTKCSMLSRTREGLDTVRSLWWEFNTQVSNESATGVGSLHRCNVETARGDCMSPVVRDKGPCFIIGYHCGGSPEGSMNPISAAFAISRPQILATLELLQEKRLLGKYTGPAVISHATVLGKQYGMDLVLDPEVHFRDVVNYVSEENTQHAVVPIGSVSSKRFQRYSEVCITPLSKYLAEQGLVNEWGPPKFNANRNHAAAFQTLIDPIKNVPEEELGCAIEDYLEDILSEIKRLGAKAQPLTMEEIINGDPNKKFVRRMNLQTSPGHGLKAPKTLHFDVVQLEPRTIYAAKDYVLEEFSKVEEIARTGRSPGHVFASALKDEPTPRIKDKVRVFEVSPLTLVMFVRKYALPLIQVLYFIPLTTEMAQGINCTNDEWDQLGRFIASKSTKNCIEGDFSGYDLRQSGQMIRAVGYILRRIALALGYKDKDAEMLEVITNEISLKVYLFNGSLFTIDGSNPSGVPITILVNGMINSLLHRIVFRRLWRKNVYFFSPGKFREHVAFATVGDDSVGSTTKSWFNMRTIQEEFALLNMPYTDGHKNKETVDYFPFEQIAFCKRTWRLDERLGKYVAPIAIASIMKSLHCCMKSKTLVEDIMVQNIDGALRELARHDRFTFEEYATKIRKACEAMDFSHMVKRLYLSYDEWYDILKEDYESPGSGSLSDSLDESLVEQASPPVITDQGWHEPLDARRPDSALRCGQTNALTRILIKYCISKNTNEAVNLSVGGTRIMNVNFDDSTTTWHTSVPVNRDSTFDAAITGDQVQDFLRRPVKIWHGEWEIGAAVSVQIDPWSAYFEDARVFERLKYFRHIRADMHIKVVVNGNPFYSGCLMLSYVPLPRNDERTDIGSRIQLSQMPHVFLQPTHSTGGEMTLPFFHYNNTLIVPDMEWRTMGKLVLKSMVPLQHANGGTDSITLTMYAAAVNVSLTTPTGIVPTPQALRTYIENQADEYGRVSSLAHSVANFAGSLYRVPSIAPYARATEMIASGIGAMATLFGFSRPRIVPEAQSLRPRYQGTLAVTNVGDNVASLAIDAKKEVTIDPRTVGLNGDDEMAIVPIAMRPSWIRTIPVSADLPVGKHIASFKVTPLHGASVPDGASTVYQITPSAFTAIPFKYWKGSFKLRALIVCSAYHKGRLRFVWDPEYNKLGTGEIYNTNYSTVVDISEVTDVTFRVGWGRNTTYLQHGGLGSITNNVSLEEYTARDPFVNGTISVYVVNPITSPGELKTGIEIMFFTSMDEDYEVAGPDSSAFGAITLAEYNNPPLNDTVFQPLLPSDPNNPSGTPAVMPVTWHDTATTRSAPGSTTATNSLWLRSDWSGTTSYGNPQYFEFPYCNAGKGTPIKLGLETIWANSSTTAQRVTLEYRTLPDTVWSTVDMVFPATASPNQKAKAEADLIASANCGIMQVRLTPRSTIVGWGTDSKYVGGMYYQSANFNYRLNNNATATLSVANGRISTNMTFPATSDSIDLFLAPSAQWDGGRPQVVSFVYDSGQTGDSFIAQLLASDGTLGSPSTVTTFNYAPLTGSARPVLAWNFPGNMVGKTIVAIRVSAAAANKSLNTANWNLYVPLSQLTAPARAEPPIEPQADEETPAAPVDDSVNDSMGPSCPLALANQIHFGEQITSFRQCIKRYTTFYRDDTATSNYKLLFNDVQTQLPLGPGTPIRINRMNMLEYVKSAYVGYRGSIRVKAMIASRSATPVGGDARISRVSYGALLSGTWADELVRTLWDGTSWEPISHTNTVDAEIPYYSQLRFYPARFTNDILKGYSSVRIGRERTWFGLNVNAQAPISLDVAKAAGEDFTCFFFLAAPLLRTVNG